MFCVTIFIMGKPKHGSASPDNKELIVVINIPRFTHPDKYLTVGKKKLKIEQSKS